MPAEYSKICSISTVILYTSCSSNTGAVLPIGPNKMTLQARCGTAGQSLTQWTGGSKSPAWCCTFKIKVQSLLQLNTTTCQRNGRQNTWHSVVVVDRVTHSCVELCRSHVEEEFPCSLPAGEVTVASSSSSSSSQTPAAAAGPSVERHLLIVFTTMSVTQPHFWHTWTKIDSSQRF